MPGDVLLFQRLSVSTIGAVRFHGRVRDGIGWGTDAMVTKQRSRRKTGLIDALLQVYLRLWPDPFARLTLMAGFIKRE